MDPTNKSAQIDLGGQKYTLLFDLNSFYAFEQATGKFFLDFLVSLQEANAYALEQKNPTLALKKFSMKDFRAFLWAAIHHYESKNGVRTAVWPLSIDEVGEKLDIKNLPRLIPVIMTANIENLPAAEDQPVEKVNGAPRPTLVATEKIDRDDGGTTSGVTDESLSDLLTKKSEN